MMMSQRLVAVLQFAAVVFCACLAALLVDRHYLQQVPAPAATAPVAKAPAAPHTFVCDSAPQIGAFGMQWVCANNEIVTIIPALSGGAK